MKIAVSIACTLFAIYAGINSYLVAHVGALYQIPQLEGDGGGGLVVAAICFIAGILVFLRWWAAMSAYCVGAIAALVVGISFQDGMVDIWSAVIALFAATSGFLMYRNHKHKGSKSSASRQKLRFKGNRLLRAFHLSKASR